MKILNNQTDINNAETNQADPTNEEINVAEPSDMEIVEEPHAKAAFDSAGIEKHFVKGAHEAGLTDTMREMGAKFDDEKLEWYFLDAEKAVEARRILHDMLSGEIETARYYLTPRYYFEADAKDIASIREVLELPKTDGGLGFKWDSDREQWYTVNEKDLVAANLLMDEVKKEQEQKRAFSTRDMKDFIKTLQKEVLHEI